MRALDGRGSSNPTAIPVSGSFCQTGYPRNIAMTEDVIRDFCRCVNNLRPAPGKVSEVEAGSIKALCETGEIVDGTFGIRFSFSSNPQDGEALPWQKLEVRCKILSEDGRGGLDSIFSAGLGENGVVEIAGIPAEGEAIFWPACPMSHDELEKLGVAAENFTAGNPFKFEGSGLNYLKLRVPNAPQRTSLWLVTYNVAQTDSGFSVNVQLERPRSSLSAPDGNVTLKFPESGGPLAVEVVRGSTGEIESLVMMRPIAGNAGSLLATFEVPFIEGESGQRELRFKVVDN